MEQARARKTYKYQLLPTPEQALDVGECRVALPRTLQRPPAGAQTGLGTVRRLAASGGVSVTFAIQSAQLPVIKEVRTEYRERNAQVVQHVLHDLDKAFAAFFRRVTAGAHPCLPVCPFCGLVLDRDLNAARNMRRAGQARQAPTWPVAASVV
jgi:transposase